MPEFQPDSMALASTSQKNACILAIASALKTQSPTILRANEQDIQSAKQAGLSPALVDRLTLNPQRLEDMINSLAALAELDDPVGQTYDEKILPNGLKLYKQRVPIGVIAVIYESRPNVTIEVAGLTIKTGNALILRGGSETIATNRALVNAIHDGLLHSGLPQDAVQFIDRADREYVTQLLGMHDDIDMLIPRGGNSLHQYCRQNSTIPVITGGIGICHLFVDESADLAASIDVIQNAKVQRPSVCNALDTVLVHERIAAEFLPRLVDRLVKDGVCIVAAENAMRYLGDYPSSQVKPAGAEDFDTEWLSLTLGSKSCQPFG